MLRLRRYVDRARTSYWFIPSLMTLAVAVLAFASLGLDSLIAEHAELELKWAYRGSAEGARQLLATVAGSMITVAGVVFSINIVGLTLASSQFGPRLLRNFIRDRGNQAVLGTFISTFVYCLLVLRSVRGEHEGEFVPQVSVTLGVLMAVASVGVLIYFIHHAAISLQAPVVIANVYHELTGAIDELFPDERTDDAQDDRQTQQPELSFPDAGAALVLATRDGYVESIDPSNLLEYATEHDLQLRLRNRAGHFVLAGSPLAEIRSRNGSACESHVEPVRDAFHLGSEQTPLQDIEFSINQLVEVAVRALSPGINDPFTAMTCVDYLGAALNRLAGRSFPDEARCDEQGTLRLVPYPLRYSDLVETAFRQIRQYGHATASVLIRMLESIADVLQNVRRPADVDALVRQATLIRECAGNLRPADAETLEQRFTAIQAASDHRRRSE